MVTIGSFHAGTARNVIPDTAELQGTLRTLSEPQRVALRAAIHQVAEQTAALNPYLAVAAGLGLAEVA